MKNITSSVSCFAYYSTLKMEGQCSSETTVDLQRTIRREIPDERTLHNHRYENLKSYTASLTFIVFNACNKEQNSPSSEIENFLHNCNIITQLALLRFSCQFYVISYGYKRLIHKRN
jgi:hypothetical protein